MFRDLRFWLGLAVSFALIFFLFRHVDARQLLAVLRSVDPGYLSLAVFATFLGYFFRALRWKYLVKPLKKAAFGNLFSATLVGYMANNLLPARLGEFVRAYALAQREQIDGSSVFATLVLDRLLDGFTVLLLLLIALFGVRFPAGGEAAQKGLVVGGWVTLGIYLAAIVVLVFLKRNTTGTLRFMETCLKPFPRRFAERIIPLVGAFIGGIRLSTHPRDLWALCWTSLVTWGIATVTVDFVLRAFHISLPLTASVFILVLLVFAVMVPASPGFIGTYHAACTYGLLAFGVEREMALSVAIVVHAVNFFPVIAAGLLCLWRGRITLSGIEETGIR
ncbi:lysylphosphatidylglycerol synthase transmembrane domain-containing protein [Geobacter sp.]|uniref:lysylphosphatidylglycerol synthase transmembrane domain-containing protein n=1 Tax=Geobacter sp. TaxID=46610 RepID=UPI003457AD48